MTVVTELPVSAGLLPDKQIRHADSRCQQIHSIKGFITTHIFISVLFTDKYSA